MKVAIKGCKGIGSRDADTECILQEEYAKGVIVVMVDSADDPREKIAEQIAKMVMNECMMEPERADARAMETILSMTEVSDKASIAVIVTDGKKWGIACNGRNKIFDITHGKLHAEWEAEGEPIMGKHIYTSIMTKSGDGVLVATDGFWSKLEEEEVLIDYIKSRTPDEWLSYLMTRIGSRLTDVDDNYSAIAVMVE